MESYWDRFTKQRTSRRRIVIGGATLALGTAGLALFGCGGSGGDGDATEPSAAGEAGTPQRGGTFGQIYSASDNLNILTNPAEYAGMGGQFVYDHLIMTRTNEHAPFVLEAAEGLEQPDEVTITFKLRKGMTYHPFPPVNGREVVAEDVVKMQEYARSLTGIENNFQVNFLDKAQAPDKYTVVYKLKEPRAYLFDSRILGHPGPQAIIPYETFDNLHSARQIGSGPFMADSWTINSKYHYTRFDKYHGRGKAGTMPYRDATDVLILQDEASKEAAFRSEQIHYYLPAPGQFDSILSSMGSRAKAVEFQGLAPYTWNMNMTKAPFTDIRFRQAMYRATNRQQFIDLLYNGKAQKPTGVLAVSLKAYQLDAKDSDHYFKFDIAEGKRLLSAMNWDTNKEITLMFTGSNAISSQGAEILKQQAAQVGIKIRADPKSGIAEISPLTQKNDYDMFIGGHPGYDTPSVPMRHNHSNPIHQFSVSGLKDKETDAMIEKAEKTTNFEENVKLVKQAQIELLKRYTSYYNILTATSRNLLNAKVQNFEVEASNVSMHRADMWLKQG
jgi:peptide/nickel transport system substrate-binding protein